ncbi:LEM domain-containing protein 1 [Larimichthys crocea]|uniref:LEM domain-containing protein 1 n=1 Tax=Larimichthys crocea TaxID=215358 RepID=UPI000900CFAD|nr:lamina-associated polypeptide 2, isoforms beta/gamma [Larimichthys crocea]
MPLFEEDPAHLSKSRLRSDLVAHNVALPPAQSRKEVYVGLHLKHIEQKNEADFSSDEEDQAQDVADKEEDRGNAEIPDPSCLTDDDLKAALLKHGVKAGPIVATTRALYEKKLRKLLQPDGDVGLVNGAEKDLLYSDSEEEEEGSEGAEEETVEQSEQATQESSQTGGFVYPQCFLLSSRLRAPASRNGEPRLKWNSGNALKSSERIQTQCSQIPAGISRASTVDQRSGLGSGVPPGSSVVSNGHSSFSSQAFSITQMVEEMERRRSHSTSADTEQELNRSNVQEHWSQANGLDTLTTKNQSLYYTPKASPYKTGMKPPLEPVKDTFKDIFPDTHTTPTGIHATCRKPIKGAAGRPILYGYPESPVSPATLERQEVERRIVPIKIQILVFLIVVVLLYLINVCVEDGSFAPFVALLDSLNPISDGEDGLLLQAETQDTPALSVQE